VGITRINTYRAPAGVSWPFINYSCHTNFRQFYTQLEGNSSVLEQNNGQPTVSFQLYQFRRQDHDLNLCEREDFKRRDRERMYNSLELTTAQLPGIKTAELLNRGK